MQVISTTVLLILSAAATRLDGGSRAQLQAQMSGVSENAQQAQLAVPARDWIAKTTDSVCGLKDVNQVSNPALIDFQACLDATPEMKKVKDNKIDVNSPEGIKLTAAAVNRVTTACETTRVANGYCSIWKTIRHKDGRTVTDITELVKAQF